MRVQVASSSYSASAVLAVARAQRRHTGEGLRPRCSGVGGALWALFLVRWVPLGVLARVEGLCLGSKSYRGGGRLESGEGCGAVWMVWAVTRHCDMMETGGSRWMGSSQAAVTMWCWQRQLLRAGALHYRKHCFHCDLTNKQPIPAQSDAWGAASPCSRRG